jgi:2'-5' RNA ligase
MPPDERQRLFFAVPLSKVIEAVAVAVQVGLRRADAEVKWVAPGHLHFTLEFLGDTPVSRIPDLVRVAGEVAAQTPPFAVTVQGLGYFPEGRRPQVIWAGCTAGKEEFADLGWRLETALAAAELAEPAERPFTPHLTLGRVRSGRNLHQLADLLETQAALELGLLAVDRFLLVRSKLETQGPVYQTVESFELIP